MAELFAPVDAQASKSVGFIPFKDPWPSARERFWDIDDQQFNDFINRIGTPDAFKYADAQVILSYDPAPAVPYFVGHIEARGLKPNFAYQLKLTGKPARGNRGWGAAGDDWSNEKIGRAGRWWCDSQHFSQTNFDDTHYAAYYGSVGNGVHDIYGYLFVGSFVTDELGNASVDFTGQASYHIDWQDKENTSLKHVLAGTWPVQSTVAPYYGYGAAQARKDIKLWYQYEAGRAQNNVQLPTGRYNCRFVLTEESFHATSFYGGYWKTVLATEDFAKDANGDYIRDSSGKLIADSNPSNDVAFVIGLPRAPANLSATGGDTQVVLAWNAAANATTYTLQRALASGGPYQNIASNITATNYTDRDVANGTEYFYVVIANNSAGESTPSNEAAAMPQAVPISPPVNLVATAVSSQIGLAWSASASAVSYTVLRSTLAGGPYETIATGLTTTSYTDANAVANVTYYYVVIAVGASGAQSTPSNEASAIVVSTVVAVPTIAPGSGNYFGSVSIALSCATAGAQIRYTTNGTEPTSSSKLYSTSFTLSASGTVKAKAFKSGWQNSATASASIIVSNTLALAVVADAYVRNGASYANSNFGNAATLEVRNSMTGSENREAYCKFEVPSNLSSVKTAKLRIYAATFGSGLGSSSSISAHAVSNVAWNESTLTWNNKPVRGSSLKSVSVTRASYSWYELDVTSYVKSELAANRRTVSLALRNSSSLSRGIAINSKEAASNAPQLVITK